MGLLSDGDYRVVFEASPDATLVVDSEGVIRDLNPQAISLFGWSRDEMEDSKVERLIPATSRSQHEEHRQRYTKAPRPRPMGQGMELQALHKDGTTFPVEISLSPGKLKHGESLVICTVRDISSWKRMRRLSKMIVTAAENERRHLSRELHDEFLQSLVALKIRMKLLSDERDHDKRERARAQIADGIYGTIRGVKRMIRGLLPPELDDQRLSSALASVFRDLADVYGVAIRASLYGVDTKLDAFTALALYRVVQEAVTNAVRHAGAEEVTVKATLADEEVAVVIRDEGCGFEMSDAVLGGVAPGVGLTGIFERAELAGGHATVETTPGQGTTVRVTVPTMGPERESDGLDGEPW